MQRLCGLTLALLLITAACAAPSALVRPTAEQALQMWTDTIDDAQHALKGNQLSEAIRLTEAAITQAKAFGPHDSHLARTLVLRAEIFLWQKDYVQAEACFKEAVSECERSVGMHSPELVHPLSSLANFYYYVQPHYDRVVVLFNRILDLADHSTPRDDRAVIMWSRNLGTIYQQTGEFERAEPLFARAVALTEKTQPEWVSHELLTQARFYSAWKKYPRAEEIALRAVAWREHALAIDPKNIDRKLDVTVALDDLATIYLAEKQFDGAERTARRSLGNAEAFLEPNSPELAPRVALMAEVLQARGKYDEAATQYQRLATLTENNLGAESAQLAEVLTRYAAVCHSLKRTDTAAKLEARAAAIHHKLTAAL